MPKPSKPRPDFPLFPHASGRWAKKIKGKLHYFGKWTDDPDGSKALNQYTDQKDDLHAGRKPRAKSGEYAIRNLLNDFLDAKESRLNSGELSPRTWNEYRQTCDNIRDAFGLARPVADLRPDDFRSLRDRLARKLGKTALGNRIQRVRTVFKWAFDNHAIETPVRFGSDFVKPSRKVMRLQKYAAGPKKYAAEDVRRMVATAGVPMRAFVLLAINGGFGPTDIATLPRDAVELEAGWITYPRPKTGVFRRVPLWPETIEAIRDAMADRPKAKSKTDDGLAFLTRWGAAYVRNQRPKGKNSDPESFTPIDAISNRFSLLCKRAGVKSKGFYSLRRTFETEAGNSRDQVAVDAVMGHVDESMAGVYRQGVDDDRLKAVTDHVRAWLWPAALDQNLPTP